MAFLVLILKATDSPSNAASQFYHVGANEYNPKKSRALADIQYISHIYTYTTRPVSERYMK